MPTRQVREPNPMTDERKQLGLQISSAIDARMRAYATDNGIRIRYIVEQALTQYLDAVAQPGDQRRAA
jgi:hypothetical protein